jgi:hypothetical protein
MAKVIIYLGDLEFAALSDLARLEFRVPNAQAALIICQELEKRGLLSDTGQSASVAGQAADDMHRGGR